MKTVLWLSSWYPNKLQPFAGDFIQRHARAVSLYRPVYLIHVIKDSTGTLTNDVRVETNTEKNLTEMVAYYKPLTLGIKYVDKILSIRKLLSVYWKLVHQFFHEHGRPDVVHVQVTMWAGVIAQRIKKRWGVPYLVTEHWTGFNPKAKDNFYLQDPIFRWHAKRILAGAKMVLPVSSELAKQVAATGVKARYAIVPNTVNTACFYLQNTTHRVAAPAIKFIHVSSMHYQKNIPGILRVFSSLRLETLNWELIMVGPADESLKEMAALLGLQSNIQWAGEISNDHVAEMMRGADAFVLFSRYENQPCVVLEALCCGLPVISSNVGGISEVISASNGMLVEPENDTALLEAIRNMMRNLPRYDRGRISKDATAQFSFQVVGKKIASLYGASK